MTAQLIDGKALAAAKREALKKDVRAWESKLGRKLGLAVVIVGEDPASQIYVRNKRRASEELGLYAPAYDLPATTSQAELLRLIAELNSRPEIDGFIVQTPLPKQIDPEAVIRAMDPDKDVDGFHPVNLGCLTAGHPRLVSCTPAGIMDLIRSTGVAVAGKKAVVIGRSFNVGKPTALLLLQENATVTICHSRTVGLAEECRTADILVAAVGKKGLVRGDWIKPGAVVIDVGTIRVDGKLYGDVEFAEAKERAGFLTPVPGGVGPMTIASLLANTVEAVRLKQEAV